MEIDFKSGFISIIGKPNVGKSTFLNAVVGERVAIVTPKPQTTRNCITGIKTLPDGQLVFLDTPGIHNFKDPFNRKMVNVALRSIEGVNIVLYMIGAGDKNYSDDIRILERIKHDLVFLLINKIDLVGRGRLLELIDEFKDVYTFSEIIPVSALNGIDVMGAIDIIKKYLPSGPKYFPDDMYTDQPERFMAAEVIRGKAMLYLQQELPYSLGVIVDEMKEAEGKVIINATIVVERNSQKGIVIGKSGSMLKKIGTAARAEIGKTLATKVILNTWVKVRPKWKQSGIYLREMRIS